MTLEVRKRLQPLDTNSININDKLNLNSNIRRTRSKTHLLPPTSPTIKDENLCRLQVQLKDFIYNDQHATISNISQNLSEDTSKPIRINFRKRCMSTETSSTESIPDCKSISNADSSTELNTFFKESLQNKDKVCRRKESIDRTKKLPQDLDIESSFITSQFYYAPSFKKIKPRKLSVNVPRWSSFKIGKCRRTRNSLFSSELENLKDEAFHERHLKYELEEKKVEEALQKSIIIINKQKKSYDAQNFISPVTHVKKWQNVVPKTLEGQPLESYIVSVKNDLPVTAFGVTLPFMKSRQFQFER